MAGVAVLLLAQSLGRGVPGSHYSYGNGTSQSTKSVCRYYHCGRLACGWVESWFVACCTVKSDLKSSSFRLILAFRAAFTSGFPLYAIYIYLPQRYQLVDGLNPLMSGVKFLVTPVAAFIMTGIAASIS